MKLKTVSNNDKKLNIFNYLIRSLLLYGTLITIINTGLVYVLNETSYFYTSGIVELIGSVLFYIIAFTIVFRKDNRGLHDIVSNTKVIYLGEEEVTTEGVVEDKIIKADYEPVKMPTRSKTKKPKVKTGSKRKTKKEKADEIENVTK